MPRPNKGARCDACGNHEPTTSNEYVECRAFPPEQGLVPGYGTPMSKKLVPIDYWCGQFKRPSYATKPKGKTT